MKYKTIVIDLPWPVTPLSKTVGGHLHSKLPDGPPYKTMTLEEIRAFPILDYADDNCTLFMWTIQSMLLFSLELVKTWGFKFHLLMTWDKELGINHLGFNRNSEFIVVAYRGKYSIRMDRKNIKTAFRERRTTHSAKPDTFYQMITKCTHEPRIDIFARIIRHGWDTFGDDPKLKAKPLESYSL